MDDEGNWNMISMNKQPKTSRRLTSFPEQRTVAVIVDCPKHLKGDEIGQRHWQDAVEERTGRKFFK